MVTPFGPMASGAVARRLRLTIPMCMSLSIPTVKTESSDFRHSMAANRIGQVDTSSPMPPADMVFSGLAVDSNYLWVSNDTRNLIEVYDKTTGSLQSQFAVDEPRGIAVDGAGGIWVAHSGDRVSHFSPTGNLIEEITNLNQPYAVSIGGPNNHLFVGEAGSSQVKEFDTNLSQIRQLFGPAEPGLILDDAFRWSQFGEAALAVDATGRMIVADYGNRRVLTFAPDATVIRTRFSEFQPAPFADPSVDPNMLISTWFQYDVDYTPGPTYGQWQVTHNWWPTAGSDIMQFAQRRRLSNGSDYIFSFSSIAGVNVYQISEDGNSLRRSAIIGGDVDGFGIGPTPTAMDRSKTDETIPYAGPENSNSFGRLSPGRWIDHEGNFWIADWDHWRNVSTTVKVPLTGFDAEGNPLYDWANRETVVNADFDYYFDANNMKISPGQR